MQFHLFTSPLIRARQTAAIICQKVRNCVRNIIPVNDNDLYTIPSCKNCPAVTPEDTIINPPNHREAEQYDGWLSNYDSDPHSIRRSQFIKKLVSSSEESMNLFITHTFPARNLIHLLEDIFSEDRSARKKIEIGNDTVYELYFR